MSRNAALCLLVLFGLTSCGLEDGRKNDNKSDAPSGARDVLVLHWKFESATAQGYVIKKISDGREAVEIARLNKAEAVSSQSDGVVSYALPARISSLLSEGDCVVVSALLTADAETAPSSRACLPRRP